MWLIHTYLAHIPWVIVHYRDTELCITLGFLFYSCQESISSRIIGKVSFLCRLGRMRWNMIGKLRLLARMVKSNWYETLKLSKSVNIDTTPPSQVKPASIQKNTITRYILKMPSISGGHSVWIEQLMARLPYSKLTGLHSIDRPVWLFMSFDGTGLISSHKHADSLRMWRAWLIGGWFRGIKSPNPLTGLSWKSCQITGLIIRRQNTSTVK